jgi:uncharacterized membrane protein YccC
MRREIEPSKTGLQMPSSQLKRAEQAIKAIRDRSELPPEAADALQELVDAVRTIENRVSSIENQGRPSPTKQMDLPNPSRETGG